MSSASAPRDKGPPLLGLSLAADRRNSKIAGTVNPQGTLGSHQPLLLPGVTLVAVVGPSSAC